MPPRSAFALEQAGAHPLLARLLATRGLCRPEALDAGLARLHRRRLLQGRIGGACADTLQQRRLCVVADYDCDGATAVPCCCAGCACSARSPMACTWCRTAQCTATA